MSMEFTTPQVTSVTAATVTVPSRVEASTAELDASIEAPAPAPSAPTEPKAQEIEAVARKRIELAERLVGANKSLVIEKDPVRSGFIYKTVDRQTGEVTRVWPQEEAASALRALADVDARGAMINTRV
jgi:uncharacterized FlaG/YvyC family protein